MRHLLTTIFKHPNPQVQEECFVEFYAGLVQLRLDKQFVDRVQAILKETKHIPSPAFLIAKYPEYQVYFEDIDKMQPFQSVAEFKAHLQSIIEDSKKTEIGNLISKIQASILDGSQPVDEALQSLIVHTVRNATSSQKLQSLTTLSARQLYEESLQKSSGPLLFIDPIDIVVGGLRPGTVTTILAFTSGLKTTCAIQSAYKAAAFSRYNVVYYSVEMPKETLYQMLLVRHSFDPKFASIHKPIDWSRMYKQSLSEEEKNFLFDVVEQDYQREIGDRIWILDPISLEGMGKAELETTLLKLHCMTGGIDYFIFDHISVVARGAKDEYGERNAYVRFLQELAVRFANGRGLSVLLLVQANRTGWERATQNEGRYDLTAIAEANEIERSSWVVIAIYYHGELRKKKLARMQVLKNRSGPLLEEGVEVMALPEHIAILAKEEDDTPDTDSFMALS